MIQSTGTARSNKSCEFPVTATIARTATSRSRTRDGDALNQMWIRFVLIMMLPDLWEWFFQKIVGQKELPTRRGEHEHMSKN